MTLATSGHLHYTWLAWIFVSQLEEAEIDGYSLLFRVQELWPLLARQQPFHNWYTKLTLGFVIRVTDIHRRARDVIEALPELERARKDNLTASLSSAWRVDLQRHILRKMGYKGSAATSSEILLAFDAMTLPAVFFAVARTWILLFC